MKAATEDSVLIEQVVHLASKARQATGQDPIHDLPKGYWSNKTSCPIARALNLNCSVGASTILFRNIIHARQVAEALGLEFRSSASVYIPTDHPFRRFISRFDMQSSNQLRELKLP